MNQTQSDELTRKKIDSILGPAKQIICMWDVRIYTSSKDNENHEKNTLSNCDEWLYSNLEGNLCYILDTHKKTRYLRLYEPVTFQLLFHMDVYENFSLFYTIVENNFHCFEFNNIFIGLFFLDMSQANNFSLMTKKLNDQIVQIMLESQNKEKESRQDKKKRFQDNIQVLKKNFKSEDKYSGDYCEDIMEINKPIFYDLLNFMSYNREKKEFAVGNVPKEFRNLFKNIGIKKHQLKKADTTLNFFKYFIESFDMIESSNNRKISSLSDNSDEEELDNTNDTIKEESKDNKENKINNQTTNTESKQTSNVPNPPKIPSAPNVPNAPKLNIPTAPKVIINLYFLIFKIDDLPQRPSGFLGDIQKGVPLKKAGETDLKPSNLPKKPMSFLDEIAKGVPLKKSGESDQKSSNLPKKPMTFLEEISKGVTLKKQHKPEEKLETIFNKPAEVTTENVNKCLMNAIQMRGFQLNKNNVNDDESEGSDSWSD